MSEELLGAYLDDELGPEARRQVRAALAEDRALAARLEKLRQLDGLMKQRASVIDETPLSARVNDLLDTGVEGRRHPRPWLRAVHGSSPGKKSTSIRRLTPGLAALAASLLVMGVLLAVNLAERWSSPVLDARALAILDAQPSGEAIALDEDNHFLARFSFQNGQGQFCREFQWLSETTLTENIACRSQTGWQLVYSETRDIPASALLSFQPAAHSVAMDSLLDEMMATDALALEDESRLIERGWTQE